MSPRRTPLSMFCFSCVITAHTLTTPGVSSHLVWHRLSQNDILCTKTHTHILFKCQPGSQKLFKSIHMCINVIITTSDFHPDPKGVSNQIRHYNSGHLVLLKEQESFRVWSLQHMIRQVYRGRNKGDFSRAQKETVTLRKVIKLSFLRVWTPQSSVIQSYSRRKIKTSVSLSRSRDPEILLKEQGV